MPESVFDFLVGMLGSGHFMARRRIEKGCAGCQLTTNGSAMKICGKSGN
jgi:hypothetical protein